MINRAYILISARRQLAAAVASLCLLTLGACSGSGSDSSADPETATAGNPPTAGSGSPPPTLSLDAWVTTLPGAGYAVSQGRAVLQDQQTCDQVVAIFGTCWGNNPAAPYVLLEPPVGAGYVDPVYAAPLTATTSDGTQVNMFYRLANTEALVTLLQMPPAAAYMGFNSYMFTRDLGQYSFAATPSNLSPDANRVEVFGSANNSVNNAVVLQRSAINWGGGQVAIVTTTNQALRDALVSSLQTYGLDPKLALTEALGSNILSGLDESADDLFTLMRYAMPVDEAAGDAWRNNAVKNVKVFRVSNTAIAVDRFGAVDLTTKPNADESAHEGPLEDLAAILRVWLGDRQGGAPAIYDMLASEHIDASGEAVGLVGPQCIAEGSECLGDSQDTDAYRFQTIGTLAGGQTAIVAGVNHTLLKNAAYTSVGVYNGNTLSGIDGASQSDAHGTLTGSAAAVLTDLGLMSKASQRLIDDLPNLYVTLISRSCPTTGSYCVALDPAAIPVSVPILLTQRAYLKPGTTTGANPDAMVTPKVIASLGN